MNEKQKKLAEYKNRVAVDDTGKVRKVDWFDFLVFFNQADNLLSDDEPVKELKDYTLAELAELVHDMAVEKGWWNGPREWHEIACLIHSEISEAVECYRNGEMAMHIDLVDGKPEGLVVELADVLIRCLDASAHYCVKLSGQPLSAWLHATQQVQSPMLRWLSRMHEVTAYGGSRDLMLVDCMQLVAECARSFNLDLQTAVVAKIEYNAKRPYRHGGKKA
jgi:hypothetical protein